MLVSHVKQNFLPRLRDTSLAAQPVAAYLLIATPCLSFIAGGEEGDWEVFGVWSSGGKRGALESRRVFLFLVFKMEAYEHV